MYEWLKKYTILSGVLSIVIGAATTWYGVNKM